MRRVTKHRRSHKRRTLHKTRRGGVTNYPPLPASPRAGNNNNNNNRSNMSNNNGNNRSNMSNNNNNGNNGNNNGNNNNNNSNYSNNNNSNYSNNNGSNNNESNNGKRRHRTVKQNTNLAMSLLFGKSRGGGGGVSKLTGTLAANNENNAPTAKPTLLVNNTSLKRAPERPPRLQLPPVHTPTNALKVANFTSFFKPGNTGYFPKPKYNMRTRDAIQGKINRLKTHTNAAAAPNAEAARQRGLNAFYARQAEEQAKLNKILKNAGL